MADTHRHSWRTHCTSHSCPWRRCHTCGAVQDVCGTSMGRIIPAPVEPQEPK